jgi:hypothetical protein
MTTASVHSAKGESEIEVCSHVVVQWFSGG